MPVSAGTSFWTEERFEQLKLLIERGLSAGEIANEIGETTRSAVMGKIHRHGLKLNNPPSTRKAPRFCHPIRNGGAVLASIKSRQKREREITASVGDTKLKRIVLARAVAAGALPGYEAIDLPETPIVSEPVALLDLKDEDCRYPIEHAIFCGAHKLDGSSYCARHHFICHRGDIESALETPAEE